MLCIYASLLILVAITAVVSARLRLRRMRAEATIQTVASLTVQNLPLPAALHAAAIGEGRAVRRALNSMAEDLERGDRLSDALARSLPGCPAEALGAVRAGESSGTLAAVLASFAARLRRAAAGPAGRNASAWYVIMMLTVVPLVLSFLMVKVIPAYARIFADFEARLPTMTSSLIHASTALGEYAPLILGLVMVLVVAVLLQRMFVRRPDRFQLSFAVLDTLAWYLPCTRRLASAAALSEQLPVMQAAICAGRDLGEAAEHAACTATNTHARWRLLRWAACLNRGDGALESARALRFPAAFLHVLGMARDTRELAGALDYLAEYYRALRDHWRRLAIEFAVPLVVAAWALLVGYIVVALFLPMVALLESVMATLD